MGVWLLPELNNNLKWCPVFIDHYKRSSQVSQRELAEEIGLSVSCTNYVLRALIEKGLVKAENFSQSPNKLGYLYLLTPAGVIEKMQLARRFLIRKQ